MHPANDIATFVRVVDRGTFAAVADEVGLTASGVSRTISRLEDRLGVKLLHRSTRRLVLTQEGETYLERARNILNEIDAAEAEVTAGRGRPRGLIRVNTGQRSPSIGSSGCCRIFKRSTPMSKSNCLLPTAALIRPLTRLM